MNRKITPEIMELVVENIVEYNGYNFDDIIIIDNTIETVTDTETEYLVFTYEEVDDYDFKLSIGVEGPFLYAKKHSVKR